MTAIRINTYEDLFRALKQLTHEQRQQPVQCAFGQVDDSVPADLHMGLAIGTVEDMGFSGARSSVDNVYHADEVVILMDHNLFGNDGVLAHNLTTGETIFGPAGKTDKAKQMKPED